ncbi:MAG: dephospho-CoA kinase [Anaerococcus sp.]|nr:dephospho-CoA kinase [Anaerococcus sp.]
MSLSRIVITGLIASGKSSLAQILRDKGYLVIDADSVNRDLLEKDGANFKAIKESGAFDYAFDGDYLYKRRLAKIIFEDKSKMDLLNSISHHNIIKEIERRINKASRKPVFVEIPLYFQMKEQFPNDCVILVTADRDIQIKRLMERDGIGYEYAVKKIESQAELEKMKENSDVIIDNSENFDKLKEEVEKLLKRGDF